ncbi:MAG TPA: adenosylhomocysteinase [Chloroflexota bacterium]|nr:adenosylhomocysteinase [Chloroflexota bacterium]
MMATATPVPSDIRDPGLAEQGKRRTDWAARQMPVLRGIAERFAKERPLQGVRIGVSLHITTETAVLLRTLRAGGAQLAVCPSNPLSTRDDVCATLVVDEQIPVFAWYGEDLPSYYRHVAAVLATRPQIVMDDGADLIAALHSGEDAAGLAAAIGGIEETTTGVIRVRSMDASGVLRFPVIAVNDALTKHLYDNRYGTGQNTIDGILRATNVLLAGATFAVAGYGWCGRGIAMRARGMGAQVIVTEIDPVKALEAHMDGFRVLPMAEAVREADIVVTVTGGHGVVSADHFESLKDGAILANSGHFDVEVDVAALRALAVTRRPVREHIEEYVLPSGKHVYLLAEGRLVGQAAAEASPAALMDMSFANQALCTEYLAREHPGLEPGVYDVPAAIDRQVAQLKLTALGIRIDQLSPDQEQYLASWQSGT